MFPEQHAIWQVGKDIVPREIGDLRLGPAALGDVLMDGHPAAAGPGLVRNRYHPAVTKLL